MIEEAVVQNIRRRAGLTSEDEAQSALQATLQTLAQRLSPESVDHLRSMLPASLAELLEREGGEADVAGRSHSSSFDDFCQRLADREGTDVPVAVFHARSVLLELRELPGAAGEFDRIAAELPNDFAPLFWPLAGAATAA